MAGRRKTWKSQKKALKKCSKQHATGNNTQKRITKEFSKGSKNQNYSEQRKKHKQETSCVRFGSNEA